MQQAITRGNEPARTVNTPLTMQYQQVLPSTPYQNSVESCCNGFEYFTLQYCIISFCVFPDHDTYDQILSVQPDSSKKICSEAYQKKQRRRKPCDSGNPENAFQSHLLAAQKHSRPGQKAITRQRS